MRTKILLVVVSIFLASCGWLSSFSPYKMEIRQGNMVTPEMRERVKVGMSRQQVSTALGSPLVSDVYHANRWDYIYRYEEKGQLLEQHRLTVYFKGDFVSSIDATEALAEPQAVSAVSAQSPASSSAQ